MHTIFATYSVTFRNRDQFNVYYDPEDRNYRDCITDGDFELLVHPDVIPPSEGQGGSKRSL